MNKLAIAVLLLSPFPAFADDPTIEGVTTRNKGTDWNLSVTLRHPDSGWDHYADGWEVLDADGNQLDHRVLAHPHEHEQPFTRSLSGVQIPVGTTSVFIRAHCLVDGWGAQKFEVKLDQ